MFTEQSSPTGTVPLAVGWIGLGDQGLPMALAAADEGLALHVWARRPSSLDALDAVDVHRHSTVADLAAACDVVCVCVRTDQDVEGLLTGLLGHLRPGSVVVNHGTGTPRNAARFAELGAEVGIAVLDAPVSGGRPAAVERRLTTMVGGPVDGFTRVRPVLETFSRQVLRLGGPGSGQWAKLLNNALMMMNQAAIADVLSMATDAGIDPVRLVEVLKTGSAGSTVLGLFTTMITAETVSHLSEVELLDMDLFDTAMREQGLDPTESTARGKSGAARMADVVRRLTIDEQAGR